MLTTYLFYSILFLGDIPFAFAAAPGFTIPKSSQGSVTSYPNKKARNRHCGISAHTSSPRENLHPNVLFNVSDHSKPSSSSSPAASSSANSSRPSVCDQIESADEFKSSTLKVPKVCDQIEAVESTSKRNQSPPVGLPSTPDTNAKKRPSSATPASITLAKTASKTASIPLSKMTDAEKLADMDIFVPKAGRVVFESDGDSISSAPSSPPFDFASRMENLHHASRGLQGADQDNPIVGFSPSSNQDDVLLGIVECQARIDGRPVGRSVGYDPLVDVRHDYEESDSASADKSDSSSSADKFDSSTSDSTSKEEEEDGAVMQAVDPMEFDEGADSLMQLFTESTEALQTAIVEKQKVCSHSMLIRYLNLIITHLHFTFCLFQGAKKELDKLKAEIAKIKEHNQVLQVQVSGLTVVVNDSQITA